MSKFERLLMPGSTELNEISRSFVDMVVPAGGLGNKLDAMYEFHARHGIKPQRGQGQRSKRLRDACSRAKTQKLIAQPTKRATAIPSMCRQPHLCQSLKGG